MRGKLDDGNSNKALYEALGKAKLLFTNYADYNGLQLHLISNIIGNMRWCLNNIFIQRLVQTMRRRDRKS